MKKRSSKSFCPKCGYTGKNLASGLCPKCGENLKKKIKTKSSFGKKGLILLLFIVLFFGSVTYIFLTNESVATELRQVRQPRPNLFYIGIDVSATISTDTLEKLKDVLIERLRNFIGDEAVSYHVTTFGNPGCADQSFINIVSLKSPKDAITFGWKVEEKIREISITKIAPRDTTPLTTPFYCFLKKILPQKAGGRIIIFSDLMNDDSDCEEQFVFPEDEIIKFGKNKNGQLIFLYPSPPETDNKQLRQRLFDKQMKFISKMKKLSTQGKIRVFFYHIPDDPLERMSFLKDQLKDAIPATMFDVVMERATRVMQTLVAAVRG